MRGWWLCLCVPLLLAAAPRTESKAAKSVERAEQKGDARTLLAEANAYLEEFPAGESAQRVRRLAGEAAFEIGRFPEARRHLEAWMQAGGRDGLERARLLAALAMARDGEPERVAPELRTLARSAADEAVAVDAAHELVAAALFAGKWREALLEQGPLLDRSLWTADADLPSARKAGEGLGEPGLVSLEREHALDPVGGVAAFLLMERRGQLKETKDTADARRNFAANWPGHPLLDQVPGADRFADEPEDSKPNRIGLLLPSSGRFAQPGELALRGVELALLAAEALGWKRPEIVAQDTGSEPDGAETALRKLIEDDKVTAVLGPLLNAESARAAAIAAERRVPVVMLLQNVDAQSESAFAWNAWMRAEDQVSALVDHAVHRMGVRTFALAYPDKEAAASVAARFWDEAQGAGGAVVAAESYPADATDFRDTARKLKGALYKAKPPAEADRVLPFLPGRRKPQLEPEVHLVRPGFEFQAVFVPDSYRRAAMLAPGFVFEEINLGGHIRDADNPPVVLLGGSALNHPDLVARGGAYVEGTVLVDGFFAGSQSQSVRRFVDAYRAAHGTDPSILEATAYDATLALIQAMHEGAVSRRDIARALRRIAPKESVTGLRGFGADGQAEHDLLVLQVKDKKIVQVWPAPPPVEPAP